MTLSRSLRLMTLACAAAAFSAGAQEVISPSTPIAAIVSRVYSPTAGSIHWRRSTDDRGAVHGYEVRRDGQLLGSFDALGYVDRALEPGRVYFYEVDAIDGAGLRWWAKVHLTTPDRLPPGPTGLRAAIYSATAAELTWDRSEVFGTRYEVIRDGDVVALTDGVTHVDTDLDPARLYHFEVVALNRQGKRSAPARLALWTAEGGPPALRAPSIDRIAVYSDTAAELFWERPAAGSPLVAVEVSRNGERLGLTDGTSYFDDTRLAGMEYRYALVAIGADGRRSDGRMGDDVIRPDNAARLIAAAFDVWRGEPWIRTVRSLPGFSLRPGFPFGGPATFACANGGTATIRYSDPVGVVNYAFTAPYSGAGYSFAACREGARLLEGSFDAGIRRAGGDPLHLSSEEGITVTGPSGTVRYRGYTRDVTRDVYQLLNTDVTPVELVRTDAAEREVYVLRDADLSFGYGPRSNVFDSGGSAGLWGSFTLASERTGGATLRVSTPESLSVSTLTFEPGVSRRPLPPDWTFAAGRLRLDADDGSALVLEADTGDASSARVSITSAAGELTVLERPWSVWRENLRFD